MIKEGVAGKGEGGSVVRQHRRLEKALEVQSDGAAETMAGGWENEHPPLCLICRPTF